MTSIVNIVHAIDTEGPLYEPTSETFKRIEEKFGIKFKNKDKTRKTINLIRCGNFKIPNSIKEDLLKFISPHLLDYNDNWSKIKKNLDKCTDLNFRNEFTDSFGGGWKYSWHCVDHVGYKFNPRKRSLGYHLIYDFYKEYLKKNKQDKIDEINFHFHPISFYKEAHREATSYINTNHINEILCRKIIDRNFFPSCFRPGFHIERPDSNFFLEQWIPFDLSNISKKQNNDKTNDHIGASGFDWRRAPKEWELYNPSYDDYQKKGNMKRYVGRVLAIDTYYNSIDYNEVKSAFKRASSGKPTLLAVTSHDFRDLSHEVNIVRDLINKVAKKFPKVKFKYTTTLEAFRSYLKYDKIQKHPSIKLAKQIIYKNYKIVAIKVISKKGKVFGPQPYLAIKLKNGKYFHDNFDFGLNNQEWFYSFGKNSIFIEDINSIFVAAADNYGNTDVLKVI